MTFTAPSAGTRRDHPFLDVRAHGVYPFASGPSLYLPELPYRLLSVLARYDPDTVVPYETIAVVLWPTAPYDSATMPDMIQNHLKTLRTLMSIYGGWHPMVFKVEYGVGVRVQPEYLPRPR
jgi:hypothetical protein